MYPYASKAYNSEGDIFGPVLAKDSIGTLGMSSAADVADPDFALIGTAGISGHKTVAPECVTYPPEQTEHSTQLQQELGQTTHAMDLPGLTEDPSLDSTAGETLFLQLQDYEKAFGDWLNLNPA